MPITFKSKGSFKNTEAWMQRMSKGDIFKALEKYGAIGTAALSAATPIDTNDSASSWSHKVSKKGRTWKLSWTNDNKTSTGVPVVILIQYGHGTGTGGYVAGVDFINPAIKPVFDRIVSEIRREVARR